MVVHLEWLIDPARSVSAWCARWARAEKDLAGLVKRFASADFAARAPAEVVEQGKDIAALEEKLLRLRGAAARLG